MCLISLAWQMNSRDTTGGCQGPHIAPVNSRGHQHNPMEVSRPLSPPESELTVRHSWGTLTGRPGLDPVSEPVHLKTE